MKTPTVFIFDMGRVLLHFDPVRCIAPYLRAPFDRQLIARVIFASEEWKMLDEGIISDEEALANWKSRVPKRMHDAIDRIYANWHLYLPELTEMTALVQDIHRAGYPIYLLSNVSTRFEELKKRFPALEYMSGVVTSSAEKLCKPDRAIYDLLLNRYSLQAEDCIFIDDSPVNVQTARLMGMRGYVFDGDASKLRTRLRRMGVKIPPRTVFPKVGLVLEGGAQRGIFTAGVLDRLMDAGYHFPYVVGTSAGACNAYSYVSRQRGRTHRCMLPTLDNTYFGAIELLKTGKFMNLQKIFFGFSKKYPFDFKTFFSSEKKLEIVATSMETGKAKYFSVKKCKYRLGRVGMASCAMPIFTAPVKIAGKEYLDGGVADSIPVARAMKQGCEKAVVILTRSEGAVPTVSGAMQSVYKQYYKKYPAFAKAICRREQTYREQLALLEQLEKAGKVFIIRPTEATVSRTEQDYDKMNAFYLHGYETMCAQMDALKAFLGIAPSQKTNG